MLWWENIRSIIQYAVLGFTSRNKQIQSGTHYYDGITLVNSLCFVFVGSTVTMNLFEDPIFVNWKIKHNIESFIIDLDSGKYSSNVAKV